MRLIATLSLALTAALATACGEPVAPESPEPAQAPAAPAPPAAAPRDGCGAAERQDWVGRGRADLPAAPEGATWRIYETGQPVTQDLRPDRLNIEIDPDSQRVVRLSCG